MNAPELETERLTLRGHTLADFDESMAMWSDPLVVRYISGRPFTDEETWARLLRYAGLWALLGMGYWVVRERASGRFVGEVGFADFHRDITPSFAGAPEVGWAIASWAHGRGLATEALRAILGWADATLAGDRGPRRIVCLIDPANTASLRVAARSGFREYARAHYRDHETLLFERTVGEISSRRE